MTLHIKPTMLKRSDHATDDSVRDCWAVGVFDDKGKIKYFLDRNGQEGVVSRSASDLMLEAITFEDKQDACNWACGADKKSPFFDENSAWIIRKHGITITLGIFSPQVSDAFSTTKLSGTNVLRSPDRIGDILFNNNETVELVFDLKRRIKFSNVYLPTMRITMECVFRDEEFWLGDKKLNIVGIDE